MNRLSIRRTACLHYLLNGIRVLHMEVGKFHLIYLCCLVMIRFQLLITRIDTLRFYTFYYFSHDSGKAKEGLWFWQVVYVCIYFHFFPHNSLTTIKTGQIRVLVEASWSSASYKPSGMSLNLMWRPLVVIRYWVKK